MSRYNEVYAALKKDPGDPVMTKRTARFNAKQITAQEAAALVRSGMWIDYGAMLGQPDAFDAALAARKDELRSIKIRSCMSFRPRAVLEADPAGEHFCWISLHFSGYDRKKHDSGIAHYLPVHLGEIPDYYRRFIEPVDMRGPEDLPDGRKWIFQLQH